MACGSTQLLEHGMYFLLMKLTDCIVSICNKTNTILLHTNSLHSILHKIGHMIQIAVHQFVHKTTAKKKCLKKLVTLDPQVRRNM